MFLSHGLTSNGGQVSPALRQVDLPILTNYQCQLYYGAQYNSLSMICAGYGSNKDVCTGDEGGPLAFREGNGIWSLVGITSWRNGCGINPGVYTRVQSFYGWIESLIVNNGKK